jgi:nitroreductase
VDTFLAIASKRDWRRYADRPLPEDVETTILDAGRLAGSAMNRQPWTFLVASKETRGRLADAVYAPDNVRTAALVVAIVVEGDGWGGFDAARAAQNMMLAAWNEGVVSCPNGTADADRATRALGLEGEERPAAILSYRYPARPFDPKARPAEEWSREANRRPLEQVVRRI